MTDGVASAILPDAILATALFLHNPHRFGGIVLRGDAPVRDEIMLHLNANLTQNGPTRKIPITVDAERLLGGLDLAATLASGQGIMRNGLLQDAHGGAVIMPMAERIPLDVAAQVALAMDKGNLACAMLDDGQSADEQPPKLLAERVAFHCDVTDLREFAPTSWPNAITMASVIPMSDAQLSALAATASALGVHSARAMVFAHGAARAHAALLGRTAVDDTDIAAAVRLVIAPRATQMPQFDTDTKSQSPQPPPQPRSLEPQEGDNEAADQDRIPDPKDLQDMMIEAAAAAIPPGVLDMIEQRLAGAGAGQSGRAGAKQKSSKRGRPKASRPGIPGQGRALALMDSLRAAAPFQAIRRQSAKASDTRTIHMRGNDLRVRCFEQRRESLTIFAVDASGSSAVARLAEAKGAVELMLAAAYVKRAHVALIAFRGTSAEMLLPPTRSLTRARRALTALPGGGGTPLAAGLTLATQVAAMAKRGGQTPMLAILTDGKANVAADGTANRALASTEAMAAATSVRASGLQSIVIDISPRPTPEAAALADALGGRYLPLPRASGAAMVAAIQTISEPQKA